VNDALYLRDFVKEAKAWGLTHLGDANAKDEYWGRLPGPVRERISRMTVDALEREQYVDFLVNRAFRRSVLCRSEAAPAGTGLALNAIRNLYITGNPAEKSAGTNAAGQAILQFGTEPEVVQLTDPRPIAVMRHLSKAWPRALPFSELAAVANAHSPGGPEDSEKNAASLLRVIDTCRVLGIVEIGTRPTDFIAATAGKHPRATRVARWQAAHHSSITSLRHLRIKADDLLRQIIPLLDGTRDRGALVTELDKRNQGTRARFEETIDLILQRLANASLLVNE
jgi:methyltransferase-like protein